ncbi:MAG: hypothetical protein AAFR98_12880 [Pseudomonadota bacterium]
MKSRLKRIILAVTIFTVVILIGYGLFSTSLTNETIKPDLIAVQIADPTLVIPKQYFLNRVPNDNSKHRDIFLSVMYPEFEPLKKTPTEYLNEGRKFENIRILIKDPNVHIPIEDVVQKAKSTFAGSHLAGIEFELEKWIAPPPILRDNEIFVHKEGNKVVGYFMCTRDGVYSSGRGVCSGKFRKFGVVIDISFDKQFLKHWPDIRDRGFSLIESFVSE